MDQHVVTSGSTGTEAGNVRSSGPQPGPHSDRIRSSATTRSTNLKSPPTAALFTLWLHGHRCLQPVAALRRENLLGFDIETRPSFKKGESHPPALLQLAGTKAVFIFQLSAIGLPAELAGLLADPGITKVLL